MNQIEFLAAELEAAAILVAMMEAAGIDPSDFIENVAGPAELRWLEAADARNA